MTGEKTRRSFAPHDLAKHHHCWSHQESRITTAPLHPRYQPGLFRDRACPLFGGGIDSLRHHRGNGDLANCECSRIHKALLIVDLASAAVISCFNHQDCVFCMSSAVEASLIDQEHGPVACAASGFLTRWSIYLTLPTFPENSGVQLRWAHRQESLCSWTNVLRSKHGFLLHLRT